jgi:hypothetical protein
MDIVAVAVGAVAAIVAFTALFKKLRHAPWCPPCVLLTACAGAGYFAYCLVRAFTPR